MMTLLSSDESPLMQVTVVARDGNDLLIKGKVLGTLPMTARLTPEEARNGLRLLGFRLLLFALTLIFRRGKTSAARGSRG